MSTTISRKELFQRFNEGTETEDAVRSLLETAYQLEVIGHDDDSEVLLDMAEEIIADDAIWCIDEGDDRISERDQGLVLYVLGRRGEKLNAK